MTTSHLFKNTEKLGQYYSVISRKQNDKLKCAWADEIINDGLPFTINNSLGYVLQSYVWWSMEAFMSIESIWPPSRYII